MKPLDTAVCFPLLSAATLTSLLSACFATVAPGVGGGVRPVAVLGLRPDKRGRLAVALACFSLSCAWAIRWLCVYLGRHKVQGIIIGRPMMPRATATQQHR